MYACVLKVTDEVKILSFLDVSCAFTSLIQIRAQLPFDTGVRGLNLSATLATEPRKLCTHALVVHAGGATDFHWYAIAVLYYKIIHIL